MNDAAAEVAVEMVSADEESAVQAGVDVDDYAVEAGVADGLDAASAYELVAQLAERVRAGEGLSLVGEGGLLAQLTRRFVEAAAVGEMDAHLANAKHDTAGRDGGNSRNGTRPKWVLTEAGPVDVAMPRDRDGLFDPQIVKKRQRRHAGVDGIVLSLATKGLTTGEIYDAEVSKELRPTCLALDHLMREWAATGPRVSMS